MQVIAASLESNFGVQRAFFWGEVVDVPGELALLLCAQSKVDCRRLSRHDVSCLHDIHCSARLEPASP